MNHRTSICSDEQLQILLYEDEETADYHLAAAHLDSCEKCQSRISELSADQNDWEEAKKALTLSEEELQIARETDGRSWSATRQDLHGNSWHDSLVDQLLSPPTHPEMLGRLGRYEIERLIGAGGMGVVFKGFDSELNRPVAVKVLAPHLSGVGAARQRFAREARAAAAIVHEHVVAIHNVESESEPPFLVMQYVAGESLQRRLDREGRLSIFGILRIARQTAAGLAAAHDQGLVHRDVKPSNILLEEGVERALLTDFGLARASDDASLTHSGHAPGTPHYMSPEQARGEGVDHRSDLFSLGSVIYAMCTGRPPFRAESSYGVLRRITDTDPRPIREINSEIPDWLCVLVNRLHAKRVEDRFQSADHVADLLSQCLAHIQTPDQPLPEELRPASARLSRRQAVWSLAAMAAAVLTVSGIIWLADSNDDRASRTEDKGIDSAETLLDDQSGDAANTDDLFNSDAMAEPDTSTDWDGTADDIQQLSRDADVLELRTKQLWDHRPSETDSNLPQSTPFPLEQE